MSNVFIVNDNGSVILYGPFYGRFVATAGEYLPLNNLFEARVSEKL